MIKRKEEEKILDVNAAMQGSLIFSDPVNLRISGKFDGNLTTKGKLIIGENAEVNADIVGENIAIAGQVKGKIKATRTITLRSTANVSVDIETPKISIEEGATFNGRCKMVEEKMSLPELADYLSIEEEKIKDWVNNDRIPAERDGEKLLFDRKKVEAWISHNR
ncbi:MAG: polymer-forming cytoskeletal protein [Candidatus Omnitrophica bacterium]|nr:polymer-forming cytoskeletal protein [Candidatus Omnitrophota bacterium]MBU0878751.1 polymer-forming cytoskeletal protein [Candidatus Omnitrophota bacterium]MBU0896587.1 polymer-forming cytoskeletal protein [Candidatus Omnitrophota bacterium]MBU1133286.1 polymer-forming cytoskeletal protein [Candidatus Omnitrophota bacterium]MBU1810222.1 polymer-forming cytoskeletal protein [Candidatus Omnitrophota bacterium]